MSLHDKLDVAFKAAVGLTLNYTFWYFLLACGTWVAFYIVLKRWLLHRKISQSDPKTSQMGRELLHSLRSLFVFGLVGAFVTFAVLSGWTTMYYRIDDYGWGWFVGSIAVMIVMHDAYFYWTHRAMHHRWLYRTFHRTHHLSTSPTPWAAYAFSPLEAVVQAGIGPLVFITIPVHPGAFSIFMLWQISFNVFGHNGYELYPRWFLQSPLGMFFNTPTHHAMHHETFRANYSLYFNVWDRLLGTNHRDYERRFQETFDRSEPHSNSRTTGYLNHN